MKDEGRKVRKWGEVRMKYEAEDEEIWRKNKLWGKISRVSLHVEKGGKENEKNGKKWR